MVTTIQIENDVKQKLFQMKLDLSKIRGRDVDYNEVIEELLALHEDRFNKKDKYETIRQLANKYDGQLYQEFRKGKLRELNKEEQKHPIQHGR
ncbi:MAG: hypothetical protein ACTSYI_12475 [Promethearchaeota archaeon]